MASRLCGRSKAEALKALDGDSVMPYSLVPSLGPIWNDGYFADITVTNQAAAALNTVIFTVQVRGIVDAIWGATFWEPVDSGARVTLSDCSLSLGEARSLRIRVRGDADAGVRLLPVGNVPSVEPSIPQEATLFPEVAERDSRLSISTSVPATWTDANLAHPTDSIAVTDLLAVRPPPGITFPLAAGFRSLDHAVAVSGDDCSLRSGGADPVQGAEWLILGDRGLGLSDTAFRALSAIGVIFTGPRARDAALEVDMSLGATRGSALPSLSESTSEPGMTAILRRQDSGLIAESTVTSWKDPQTTARSGVDLASSANVERLMLVGRRAVDGVGSIANDLRGGCDTTCKLRASSGSDRIWGRRGADRLDSGSGDELDGEDGSVPFGNSGRGLIGLRSLDADTHVAGNTAPSGIGNARLMIDGRLLPGEVSADAKFDLGSAWLARGGPLS